MFDSQMHDILKTLKYRFNAHEIDLARELTKKNIYRIRIWLDRFSCHEVFAEIDPPLLYALNTTGTFCNTVSAVVYPEDQP